MNRFVTSILDSPLLATLSMVRGHTAAMKLKFTRKPFFKKPPLTLEHPAWSLDTDEINPHDETLLNKLQMVLMFHSAPNKSPDANPTEWASCADITRTKVLRLRAVHLGKLKKDRIQTILASSHPSLSLRPALFKIPTNQDKTDDRPYIGDGSEYDAGWSTLCADTAANETVLESTATSPFRRARDGDVEAFETWRDWILQTPKSTVAPMVIVKQMCLLIASTHLSGHPSAKRLLRGP